MAEHAVSVVTGANRGIGLEVCRQLGALGHTVFLSARAAGAAAERAGELRAEGLDVRPLTLDVTDEGSIARAAREVSDTYGRVDVLVNNAAVLYDTWQRAVSADLALVAQALDTNLYGPWRVTQAFLPLLRAAGRDGGARIVNVSSESGSLTGMGGGTPAYSVSKAGLNALTRMLAAELHGEGVLVNSVCPGWVATDMGGPGGGPVREGAANVVWAATLPADGPTGGFFRDGRQLPW